MWWNYWLCGWGGSSWCDRALSTLINPSSPHQPHLGLLLTSPGLGALHRHSLGPLAPACAVLEECWSAVKLCLTTDTPELCTDLTSALPCHCEWAHELLDEILNLCMSFLAWPCTCLLAMILPFIGLVSWLDLVTASGLDLLKCCGARIRPVTPWPCCSVPYLLPCKELWKEMTFHSANSH